MNGLARPTAGGWDGDAGLDGATKAAIVLLAANRAQAMELLKRLDSEDVRAIARGAERLGAVDRGTLSSIIASFERAFLDGVRFVGTPAEVQSLIADAIGAETGPDPNIAPPDADPPADPWSALKDIPTPELNQYLSAQHPQVAAFILSRIDAERAAELMQSFEVDRCTDLMTRMLALSDPSEEVLAAIEQGLVADLMKEKVTNSAQSQTGVASVLNRLDHGLASTIMGRLQRECPGDARSIERMLFRFEDLPRLPARSLATVVEAVPVETLVSALAGASPELQAAALGVMSARARRMAESELQNSIGANPRVVAAARQTVVDSVLRMTASGEIVRDPGEA
ncbi:MAG: FliG C-terminal domain-containing protein [Hyphomicrobium sp.]|nr:FliG C-terminal domain-containing protein [Hyphomicrobium sp.]